MSSLTLAPSLIAVTETWLKPNYSESIVNLPGYSFISNPRIQTQGGCVEFYVKDNLVYSTRLDLNRMEEKFFKSLFIDVKFINKTITFGCIYRAPCNDIVSNSSFLDILNNTLKRIKKRDCFLLSDFNYNIGLLDCEKPQISDFVNQMFNNRFAFLINKSTRILQNNATLLDHIWSNLLVSMKINYGILTHCISDHLPVIMCTSISKIFHQNVQQCRHFSDQNVNLFSKALSESDITPILCDTDPNSSYQKLQKLYMNKFENFFLLTKISYKKTNNQCFNLNLHTLLNKKTGIL